MLPFRREKKYGKIGWNVLYDFNDSDFRISYKLIQLYLNKSIETNDENLPWETMRYLIGESMYGGRVTNGWDRRILNTYLHEFMGEFIFDQNQKFFFSRVDYDYAIPQAENMEQFQVAIDEIPLFTSPGVFGLHSNAEISYFTNAAKELWFNTLQMQTSDGAAAGSVNREEYIEKVAGDILNKLPEVFDIYNIRKQFDTPSPTQIVLMQELERFNKLLEVM
jgi:dynein heavy chain